MAQSTTNGTDPIAPVVASADPELEVEDGPDDGEPVEGEGEGEGGEEVAEGAAAPSTGGGKKKKKKGKGKLKGLLETEQPKLEDKMTDDLQRTIVEKVRDQNGNDIATQLASMDKKELGRMLDQLKILDVAEGKTGIGGKNKKDMADHKFWSTQPVRRLDDDNEDFEEGEIEPSKEDGEIRKAPIGLPDGYEWYTMDLADPVELKEVYELLTHNYVEDDDAMFRFDYSAPFIDWALRPPGYVKDWHVGIRVSSGKRKLVAFIAGIPMQVRVRAAVKDAVEINFLCIHKKLRAKRLAPVLIKEVTRRCHVKGIFQAIYTVGVLLPTPISRCQYFHRNLNPSKLVATGFSAQPRGCSIARLNRMYKCPDKPSVPGLREMVPADGPAVDRLMRRYMGRFDLAHAMSTEETLHGLLKGRGTGEMKNGRREGQVVWTYVVENPDTKLITDVFSFYSLPSTAMNQTPHQTLDAVYLYLYASTAAPSCADLATKEGVEKEETKERKRSWIEETPEERRNLKKRLLALMQDALTIAQQARFDVFNALTLMDNTLFVQDLQFGPGDGFLHYYLYNWKVHDIRGGIAGERGGPQGGRFGEGSGSGVGIVML